MRKMDKGKENRLTFLFSGIVLIGMAVYLNADYILDGQFPPSILLLAAGINQLLMSYLSPHLFPRDERSKEIMGKAMAVNYFVLFCTIVLLFLATSSYGIPTLTAEEVLIMLAGIMMISIPATMVYYARAL
ncbi:hypothetical protein [Planococcus sp. YIM B11945]|uniref:hypothetical protein n=1 Tax=Planococcus sp. YIM B11945 TaxID=3435410 RepID=UPI003D7CCDED